MAKPSDHDRCKGCGSKTQRMGVYVSFWVFFGLTIVVLFSVAALRRIKNYRHWSLTLFPLLIVLTTVALGIATVAQQFCIKGCDDNASLLCVAAVAAAATETQSTDGSSNTGTDVAIGAAVVLGVVGIFWYAANRSAKPNYTHKVVNGGLVPI